MSQKYQVVKGFRDILPSESRLFWIAEKSARELFANYGYSELMLPIIESYELFSRSIGEATDIIEKEMFIIPDKKGRGFALRPEGTAGAVRAYIEGLENEGPSKLFYYGPMFRYERPQKGRYRQFWQIGAEAIGYPGPGVDAELILMLDQYFKGFGLSDIELRLNSLGCRQCRPPYREALVSYLKKNEAGLCEDCQRRIDRNPLRVLDCKNEGCKEIVKNAPSPSQFLCNKCSEHFNRLCLHLDRMKVSYLKDDRLVRGLDYYTRTVFEFQAQTGLGAQNAIAAGGRYDDLVEELGGDPAPAIGFALGVERLVILLEQKISANKISNLPDVFLISADEQGYNFAFKLLFNLRKAGTYAEMAIDEPSRSVRSQFKLADKFKSKAALIVGGTELSQKSFNIKILESGKEIKLDFGQLKELVSIDWEEMKTHLSSAGFAFVSREYEKTLSENQSLFSIMRIYYKALSEQEE